MIFLPLSTVSYMQALTDVSLFQRDRLAQQLATRRGYLARLLELFRVHFLSLMLVGGRWRLPGTPHCHCCGLFSYCHSCWPIVSDV